MINSLKNLSLKSFLLNPMFIKGGGGHMQIIHHGHETMQISLFERFLKDFSEESPSCCGDYDVSWEVLYLSHDPHVLSHVRIIVYMYICHFFFSTLLIYQIYLISKRRNDMSKKQFRMQSTSEMILRPFTLFFFYFWEKFIKKPQ